MSQLDWDPEVESPATIAIIGGGPVGIEVAIYARFLGYFVSIFESKRVAHRMLDWHNRKLSVSVRDCTTPLGMAAIKAQNPDFRFPDHDTVWTGKEYAENYLLPLAKTDLLFDDIHFLSPVTNISRLRTKRIDRVTSQERCNDEFRIVVEGRHRGTWTSRADIVVDCRGAEIEWDGTGPGGGCAINESLHRDSFLKWSPLDRKFEEKTLLNKRCCLVGSHFRALQFVREYRNWKHASNGSSLVWIVPPSDCCRSEAVENGIAEVNSWNDDSIQTWELLGIEQISRTDSGWQLQLVSNDSSTLEYHCDELAVFSDTRWSPLPGPLQYPTWLPSDGPWEGHSAVTVEPGYYRIPSTPLGNPVQRSSTERDSSENEEIKVGPWGGGIGLKESFESIRKMFSLIGGRETLDLYKVMAANIAEGRV